MKVQLFLYSFAMTYRSDFQNTAQELFSISPLNFVPLFVRTFTCLSVHSFFGQFVSFSLSNLGSRYPSKLLNRLSSNFQGMCLQIPSFASSHYFSNMSVCESLKTYIHLIFVMQACEHISSLTAERIKLKFSGNIPSNTWWCIQPLNMSVHLSVNILQLTPLIPLDGLG